MVEYKLTVVKISEDGSHLNGSYVVSHSNKSSNWYLPDREGVILHMAKLYQRIPSALTSEPILIGLNDDDKKIVMNARETIMTERLEQRL